MNRKVFGYWPNGQKSGGIVMEQNTPLEKNTMESAPCGFSIAMNKAAVSARTAVRRKRIIRLEEKCKSQIVF